MNQQDAFQTFLNGGPLDLPKKPLSPDEQKVYESLCKTQDYQLTAIELGKKREDVRGSASRIVGKGYHWKK